MKKCHGGLDTIVATVLMVVIVVLHVATSVVGLSRDTGTTMNQSVKAVEEAQNNSQVLGNGGTIKFNDNGQIIP